MFRTFVSNRLRQIKQLTKVQDWYTGAKKDWHPYLINTIEMRSL